MISETGGSDVDLSEAYVADKLSSQSNDAIPLRRSSILKRPPYMSDFVMNARYIRKYR